MKNLYLTLILIFYCFAQNKYENSKFTINTLESSESSSKPVQMFLPQSNGFSPNVSVMIQDYPEDLNSYWELTLGQFKQLNWTVISNKIEGNSLTVEYKGMTNNLTLRFYAKAIKSNNKVYLVTGGALENQWEKSSREVIDCVESFKLK